jgi:hypothetical protein
LAESLALWWQRRMDDLSRAAFPYPVDPQTLKIGVRGRLAARRLANPVTLCHGHGVFVVAIGGSIQTVAHKWRTSVEQHHA